MRHQGQEHVVAAVDELGPHRAYAAGERVRGHGDQAGLGGAERLMGRDDIDHVTDPAQMIDPLHRDELSSAAASTRDEDSDP